MNAFVALLSHTAGGVGLRAEYLWDAENRLVRGARVGSAAAR